MNVYRASPSRHSAVASRQRQGHWLWGCGLGLLLIGLLFFAHRQPFSRSGHMLFQGAIVLLVYGLLIGWRQINRTALGAVKPTAKPKIVYVVYTPLMEGMTNKSAPALPDLMAPQVAQDISMAALPLCDRMLLQDQRN